MKKGKIRIGIIGGAGYTAGELIRLLVNHPAAEIAFVHSTSNAGHPVSEVHAGLEGEIDMDFAAEYDLTDIDLLFLCSAHGKSREFWSQNERPKHLKVIDLAQDYRDESEGYVYGLPEVNIDRIARTDLLANPGCFATAIQLALLPLAKHGLIGSEVNVTAITGSTGAGVKPGATTHFSWRNNNLSVYKAFEHQHLKEINRTLSLLQPGWANQLNFLPVRGDFARGIMAAVYTRTAMPVADVMALYRDFYAEAPMVIVTDRPGDLKQVVNTNKALLQIEKHGDILLVVSFIDNLLKGASGQAVQNMNIMFGLDQTTGLKLKPSAF